MKEDNLYDSLLSNLKQYKRKYYLNRLLKGLLITAGLVSSVYLSLTLLEYYGRFNSGIRLFFFIALSGTLLYTLISWVAVPLFHLKNNHKQLSDEEASLQIGKFFPEIKDKLLNTLQLSEQSKSTNALVIASIQQRAQELNKYDFPSAIQLSENRKYFRFVLPPLLLIISGLLFFPSLFSESTDRIIRFNTQFSTPAPFLFKWSAENEIAYRNQNLDIHLELVGDELPQEAYIWYNGQRHKLRTETNGTYSFTFHNIQRDLTFEFEAAGFRSGDQHIALRSKPDIRSFDITLQFPAYLNRSTEVLRNIGNLTVPEGTVATWNFQAVEAEQLSLRFSDTDKSFFEAKKSGSDFEFKRTLKQNEPYHIQMISADKGQSDPIRYNITIQKDQFPGIGVEEVRDTVLQQNIQFGGSISDDYGLTKLQFVYEIQNTNRQTVTKQVRRVPVQINSKSQSFYYKWNLDSIELKEGYSLRYFFEVFDNDGVNGPKKSTSEVFTWNLPTKANQQDALQAQSMAAMESYQQLAKQAAQVQKEMNQLEEKIRTKKTLNWQDKKALEDMVQKHQQLQQNMEQLNKEMEQLNKQQQKFDPVSEELAKQMEQIQKMLDKMMDEDMKKKLEELEKLLQQNVNKDQLEELLKKINKDDQYLKQELDRTLEMYKQMEFNKELEQATKQLEELQKKQEELSQKSLDNKQDPSQLQKEQDQLNKEFEEFGDQMKQLEDLNQDMQDPQDMDGLKDQQQSIQQDMKQGSQQLQEQQKKKASDAQKNAAKKMQEMKEQMQQMQQQSMMAQAEENYDDLRQILDNLLHLSFAEEELMRQFKTMSQSDPRYVALSQQQLKLQEDSKIIKDSLMALAARVPQIESYVTKELFAMNNYMEESMVKLKVRRPELAVSDMQYAMTSMNNLALMLSEVLKQMQQDMQNMQMMMSSGKQCNKPKPGGQGQPKPKPGDMGKMQQQLNQKIEQLKNSGASGQQLSEELAKLAAQQEALRKAVQELEKMMQDQGQGNSEQLKKLKDLMEQTERDLVNKNISNETINRQREILTRLLEAEKSVRERDWDDSREAQHAKPQNVVYPPSLEKYLKAKERQLELLKTVPPSYTPYYKQEVEEYFKTLE
ncbi:MAG: DUF4175 family protein [Cytophagaceae bacterium]